MKAFNQRTNKFKDRDTYTVKRVDMSQFLPKLDLPLHKKKTIDIRSPRSKSQVVKPLKRFCLHDEITKKHKQLLLLDPRFSGATQPGLQPLSLNKVNTSIKHDISTGPNSVFSNYGKESQRFTEYEFPEFRGGSIKTDFDPRHSLAKSKLNRSDIKQAADFRNTEKPPISDIRNSHGRKTEAYLDIPNEAYDPRVVATEEREEPMKDEFKEYEFLNQAKSINIFQGSPDEYEKIDMSMQLNNKEHGLIEAINSLKESFENKETYDDFNEDLDMILDSNYKEMKVSVDYTDLADLFCDLLAGNELNFERKLRILSFMYCFCEEGLFGLTLDFVKVYRTTMDFSFKLADNDQLIGKSHIRRNIHRAVLSLHRGFIKEFYFLEKDKMEIITEKVLMGINSSWDWIRKDISNEDKFLGSERFTSLFSQFGDQYIELFKILIKKSDVREYILSEEGARLSFIKLLNGLTEFLDMISQSPIDHYKEQNIQRIHQYILNSYDIYINVFKYCEMSVLWNDKSFGLRKGIEEMITNLLSWLAKLMNKRKFFVLLFDRANDSNLATPATAHGGFTVSSIANVLESIGSFLDNGKLYEKQVVDFEKILMKIIDLSKTLQNLINAKAFKPDFEMFAEGVIKQPFKKFGKRIIKHLDLLKGEKYFENDPLADII